MDDFDDVPRCPDCGARLMTPEDHAFHDCSGDDNDSGDDSEAV